MSMKKCGRCRERFKRGGVTITIEAPTGAMAAEQPIYCPACQKAVHGLVPINDAMTKDTCASSNIKTRLRRMKRRYIIPIILVPLLCLLVCLICTSRLTHFKNPTKSEVVPPVAGYIVNENLEGEHKTQDLYWETETSYAPSPNNEMRREKRDMFANSVFEEDVDPNYEADYYPYLHGHHKHAALPEDLFPNIQVSEAEQLEDERIRLYEGVRDINYLPEEERVPIKDFQDLLENVVEQEIIEALAKPKGVEQSSLGEMINGFARAIVTSNRDNSKGVKRNEGDHFNFLFPLKDKKNNGQVDYESDQANPDSAQHQPLNYSGLGYGSMDVNLKDVATENLSEKVDEKESLVRKKRDIGETDQNSCTQCGSHTLEEEPTTRLPDEDHYAEYVDYAEYATAEEIVWTVPETKDDNESSLLKNSSQISAENSLANLTNPLVSSSQHPSEETSVQDEDSLQSGNGTRSSNFSEVLDVSFEDMEENSNDEAVPANSIAQEFLETGKSDPLGVDKYSSDGEGNEKLSWQELKKDTFVRRETYVMDKSKRKTKIKDDPGIGTFWRGGGNRDSIRQIQASIMKRYMDISINPCTDFYQYACGNWSRNHPIPKDKGGYDTFELLRESLDEVLRGILEEPLNQDQQRDVSNDARLKAKYLYQSCMDYDILEKLGENPLLQLLGDFGGWPIITTDWNATEFNWISLMAKLRLFNNDILLSEWVGPDIKNSDEYIIQFDQTTLGLPTREYFLQHSNMKYLNAYKAHMIQIATLLGASIENATVQAEEMIQFETKLASLTSSPEQRRNVSALYQRMSVRSLRKIVPQLDWYTYLDLVLARPVRVDEPVVVFALKYIQDMIRLVAETPPRVVANYLLWRFVRHRVSNLDDRFQDAKQRFYFTVFGREQSPPRWKSCVSQVNSNMGMALGAMFVDQYFDEDSKNDTLHMTLSITQSFRELLGNTSWIDKDTKRIALWKVGAMLLRIGYPDFILDEEELNRRFKDVEITPTNYFTNTLNILRHITRIEQDRIGEQVNKTQWNTAPAVVNAYYSRNKNQIIFPAGMLQPPFYHRYFPKSLNFGGIGVVIGHEITHGFDDKGRLFDHHGNLQRWWSDEAIEGFRLRAQCLIDQYSQYIVPDVNLTVDGINTQGENIADNGGIKQAYIAYHRWLDQHGGMDDYLPGINATNDQLFFLNYAQVWCGAIRPETARNKQKTTVHAPGKYRVIGTLSNSRNFAKAYECPPGSVMNPVQKCSVW